MDCSRVISARTKVAHRPPFALVRRRLVGLMTARPGAGRSGPNQKKHSCRNGNLHRCPRLNSEDELISYGEKVTKTEVAGQGQPTVGGGCPTVSCWRSRTARLLRNNVVGAFVPLPKPLRHGVEKLGRSRDDRQQPRNCGTSTCAIAPPRHELDYYDSGGNAMSDSRTSAAV